MIRAGVRRRRTVTFLLSTLRACVRAAGRETMQVRFLSLANVNNTKRFPSWNGRLRITLQILCYLFHELYDYTQHPSSVNRKYPFHFRLICSIFHLAPLKTRTPDLAGPPPANHLKRPQRVISTMADRETPCSCNRLAALLRFPAVTLQLGRLQDESLAALGKIVLNFRRFAEGGLVPALMERGQAE